jgi:hypothetical protein
MPFQFGRNSGLEVFIGGGDADDDRRLTARIETDADRDNSGHFEETGLVPSFHFMNGTYHLALAFSRDKKRPTLL